MTYGLVSVDAPGLACFDSGRDSFSAASRVFAVVVTMRKISTTSSTSIRETMITEGVRRCPRGLKCMARIELVWPLAKTLPGIPALVREPLLAPERPRLWRTDHPFGNVCGGTHHTNSPSRQQAYRLSCCNNSRK